MSKPAPSKKSNSLNYTPLPKRLLPRQKEHPNLLKGNIDNNGGRPTKFRPEFVDEVYKYLEEAKKQKNVLIGVEDFASHLNVDDETVLKWAAKKLKDEQGNVTKKLARPEFAAAIKRLKSEQKRLLMKDGMYGGKDVNSTMAIFLLKVNHGMIESNHTDLTTKGEKLEPVKVVTYKETANG